MFSLGFEHDFDAVVGVQTDVAAIAKGRDIPQVSLTEGDRVAKRNVGCLTRLGLAYSRSQYEDSKRG
ncbi:hypothetical protein [Tolypothrix sp. VBCCA 56010]|uniref:hypothetical protein n=1 Tax=Tolypothrix sp. VBCCA 56010 TaxID=3137731 RepID=UPI003D7EFA1A